MKKTIITCDQCKKESKTEYEAEFWHVLHLRRPNRDWIPAVAETSKKDFCSNECLLEYASTKLFIAPKPQK